jgi:V8-like Glu-specific endopeptidase
MKKELILIILLLTLNNVYSQNCVLDSNNRKEIIKEKYENNFIAHIEIYRNRNRKFDATVSFISPNVMIGAGHSFRERWYSKIDSMKVFIGQRNNESGNNVFISEHTFKRKEIKTWVHKKFQRSGNPDFDYAIISLNKNIVNDYFELAKFSEAKTDIKSININGYPSDKDNIELWTKNTQTENVTEKENVLLYDMYTFKGDSGAPVWINKNGKYQVLGIHGTGHYRNGSCNGAVKIKDYNINIFEKFIAENKVE